MNKNSLFVAVVAVVASSCNEDNALVDSRLCDTNTDVENVCGTLHFANADAFFSTSEKIMKMSYEERESWEEKIGFTSLNTFLRRLSEQYEYTDTLVALYPQYFDVEDSITVCIVPEFYSYLADEKGFFYVQDAIHMVDGRKVAFGENGSTDLIRKVMMGEVIPNYEVLSFKKKSMLKSTQNGVPIYSCGEYGGKKNKYKSIFTTKIYIAAIHESNNTYYQYEIETKIENRQYKLGKYREHHSEESGWTDIAISYTNYFNNPMVTTSGYIYSRYGYDRVTVSSTTKLGNRYLSESKVPAFLQISGTASSSDVGDFQLYYDYRK
ncbi:MAG: hypothetical protein MJZ15_01905 [Bacteroidales bacterium]|nr:hypothetical protein [Bacteroidales bacterium]